jgi:hypothetical protein
MSALSKISLLGAEQLWADKFTVYSPSQMPRVMLIQEEYLVMLIIQKPFYLQTIFMHMDLLYIV